MRAGKVGGAPGSGRQNGRSFHKRMEEWVGLLLERVPRARSEWAGDGRSFVGSGRGFEGALTRYWELQSQLGPRTRASPGEWLPRKPMGTQAEKGGCLLGVWT